MSRSSKHGDGTDIVKHQPVGELISDASYRLLVEGIVDLAIYMLDPTGTVVSWNSGAARLKGYAADEIIGSNFARFYTPADAADGLPQQALRIAATTGKYEGEGWRVRKGGSRFWANVVIDALHDDGGRIIGFAKVTRDTTEHSVKEEQHRLIVEAAPNGMLIIDAAGNVALANAQAQRMFGHDHRTIAGMRAEQLFRDDIFDVVKLTPHRFANDDSATLSSFHTRRELTGVRSDATSFPVEVTFNVTPTATGPVIVASVTDISDRKAAERDRDQLERKWSTTFQRAVLPVALPAVIGCSFDAVYEPGLGDGQVGGDWYDAVKLADGRVLVSIGDVAGSGLEAAVVVGVVRQIMRGIAQLRASPMLVLDAADRALCLEYPGVYVSAWVGVIDLVTRTLTYASAGHPPPLLISTGGAVRELCDETTLLIGLREGHLGQSSTLALAAGDTLVLYTDGVTEAGRDVIAGSAALRAAASELARAPQPNPAQALKTAVIPAGSHDDVAILVVRTDYTVAEGLIERRSFSVADRDAAVAGRRQLIEALARRGYAAEDCANAEIVFGELLGNVVRHTDNTGDVEIAVDHAGPQSVLHVLDRGPGFSHVSRLPSDLFAENGRGLFLVAALTVDFTVSGRPDGGSHARAVLRGASSRSGDRASSRACAMS